MDPVYVTIIAGTCSIIALFAGLLTALRLQVPKQLALKKTVSQLEMALRDRQGELEACQAARAAAATTTAHVQQQTDAHQALEIEAAELRATLTVATERLRAVEHIAAAQEARTQILLQTAEATAAAFRARSKHLQEQLEAQQAERHAELLQACRMSRLQLRDHYADKAETMATSLHKIHEQDAPRRDAIRAMLDEPVDAPTLDIERKRAEAMEELKSMNHMHTVLSDRRTTLLQLVEAIDDGLRATSEASSPAQ